jgi:hypothetical protein
MTMAEDAIKPSGNGGRLELRELTELIEEALLPSSALAGCERTSWERAGSPESPVDRSCTNWYNRLHRVPGW